MNEGKALKQMRRSILCRNSFLALTGVGVILASPPKSHSACSFTDLNIEYGELKLAIDVALSENKLLRESIAENAKAIIVAKQRIVDVSNQGALFKAQASEMKLRMDALGIGVVAGGSSVLEQRLLSAVNQLRAMEVKNVRVFEALVRLTEAAGLYVRADSDQNAESRLTLETEIRNSNSVLLAESTDPGGLAVVPSLENGRIVSANARLSLVVVNMGSSSGVKLGMPMLVIRDQQVIGHVKVVDVREKIAGAVIQDLVSQTKQFKIGDHVNVAAVQ